MVISPSRCIHPRPFHCRVASNDEATNVLGGGYRCMSFRCLSVPIGAQRTLASAARLAVRWPTEWCPLPPVLTEAGPPGREEAIRLALSAPPPSRGLAAAG